MGILTNTIRDRLLSAIAGAGRRCICGLALACATATLVLCADVAVGQDAERAAAAAKAVVEKAAAEAQREIMLKMQIEAAGAEARAAASEDDVAAAEPATETEDDANRFIEESGLAETYLERLKSLAVEGDWDTVAELIPKLVEIGPESVVKGTGLGVAQSLTELILSWPPEMRQKYEAAIGPEADEALKAARAVGTIRALTNVVRDFPGTQAARQARSLVWAQRIESGDLVLHLTSAQEIDKKYAAARKEAEDRIRKFSKPFDPRNPLGR